MEFLVDVPGWLRISAIILCLIVLGLIIRSEGR